MPLIIIAFDLPWGHIHTYIAQFFCTRINTETSVIVTIEILKLLFIEIFKSQSFEKFEY